MGPSQCVDDKVLVANDMSSVLDEFDASSFPIKPTGRQIPSDDIGYHVDDIYTLEHNNKKSIVLVQTSCHAFGKLFLYVFSNLFEQHCAAQVTVLRKCFHLHVSTAKEM